MGESTEDAHRPLLVSATLPPSRNAILQASFPPRANTRRMPSPGSGSSPPMSRSSPARSSSSGSSTSTPTAARKDTALIPPHRPGTEPAPPPKTPRRAPAPPCKGPSRMEHSRPPAARQHGYLDFASGELKARARVRVVPQIPYENNLDKPLMVCCPAGGSTPRGNTLPRR